MYTSINIPFIQTKPDANKTVKLFFNPTQIRNFFNANIQIPLTAWMPNDIFHPECQSPEPFLQTDSVQKTVEELGKPLQTQGLGSRYNLNDIFKIIQVIVKKFEIFDINFDTSGIPEADDYARVYFTTMDLSNESLSRAERKTRLFRLNNPAPWPWCFRSTYKAYGVMQPHYEAYDSTMYLIQKALKTNIEPQPITYTGKNIWVFSRTAAEESDYREGHYTPYGIGLTAAHEIGHAFGLLHWGEKKEEGDEAYFKGIDNAQSHWNAIMGADFKLRTTNLFDERGTLQQWSRGEYPKSKMIILESFLINGQYLTSDIYNVSQVSPLVKKPDLNSISSEVNFKKSGSLFGANYYQCEKIKIVGKDQMNTKDPGEFLLEGNPIPENEIINGPDVNDCIIGMIGFPYNFEITKTLLEAGEYTLSVDRYDHSMLDAKIAVLHPSCEINKTKYNLREGLSNQSALVNCSDNKNVYYTKEIPENKKFSVCIGLNAIDLCPICDSDPMPPDTFNNEANTNQKPAQVRFSSEVKIRVKKRSFVYILVSGSAGPGDDNVSDKENVFLNSRYGSVGKYKIKGISKNNVSKISEPIDCHPVENSDEFLNSISQNSPYFFQKNYSSKSPSNSLNYPDGGSKYFLKTIENGVIAEPLFFVQEKEDYPVENINKENIPFTKFFPVVINGKLCTEEVKFVVYGKEYELNDTAAPDSNDVSFYYIIDQSGSSKKIEFIIYNVESHERINCNEVDIHKNTKSIFSFDKFFAFNVANGPSIDFIDF
jgi:hypothetical protein